MSKINDISATALLTLQCHALDAKSKDPILNNEEAANRVQKLSQLLNQSFSGRIKQNLVTHIALRAKQYDQVARDFLKKHPKGIVVNIGCGFDNRFERIDNGQLTYFDLDLPDVIHLKEKIVKPASNYHLIARSVFETEWIKEIPEGPLLFLAEGVFMYCQEAEIRELFANLGKHFDSYEIFFEVFNAQWTTGWKKKMTEFKLKKQLHFGKDASFSFGLNHSEELENWGVGLKFIKDWSYLDSEHPALGGMSFFRRFDLFRKMQWSVYYQF